MRVHATWAILPLLCPVYAKEWKGWYVAVCKYPITQKPLAYNYQVTKDCCAASQDDRVQFLESEKTCRTKAGPAFHRVNKDEMAKCCQDRGYEAVGCDTVPSGCGHLGVCVKE